MNGFPKARLLGVAARTPLPTICAQCCWWKPLEPEEPKDGHCRARAPELPPRQTFPITDAFDKCGAFKRDFTPDEWTAVKAALSLKPRGDA